jgi:hypothetical protein
VTDSSTTCTEEKTPKDEDRREDADGGEVDNHHVGDHDHPLGTLWNIAVDGANVVSAPSYDTRRRCSVKPAEGRGEERVDEAAVDKEGSTDYHQKNDERRSTSTDRNHSLLPVAYIRSA